MSEAFLTGAFWVIVPLVAVLLILPQKKGRSYWLPNRLFVLAISARPIFFLLIYAQLRNVEEVTNFSSDYHASTYAYGVQVFIMLYALALVVRINLAKPGSEIDWRFRVGLPSPEQIEESAHVMDRADKHGLFNEKTKEFAEAHLLTRDSREAARLARLEEARRIVRERNAEERPTSHFDGTVTDVEER